MALTTIVWLIEYMIQMLSGVCLSSVFVKSWCIIGPKCSFAASMLNWFIDLLVAGGVYEHIAVHR